ncbi:MAG: glycosyltransferase family 39 protein [bacterium]
MKNNNTIKDSELTGKHKFPLVNLLLLFMSALLIIEIVMSLSWRMQHDSPIMYYIVFLAKHYHLIFYKEIFDMNMPGTYLFFSVVSSIFGHSDLGFRLTDIIWLLLIMLVTWGIMQRFGKIVAWASIVLFGLSYFHLGAESFLQREFIALAPISLAVFVAIAQRRLSLLNRSFWVGFLFGLSAIIKPALAVGLPVTIFYLLGQTEDEKGCWNKYFIILFSLVGLTIPIFSSIVWLWQQGSLPYFMEMVLSYLPLYGKLAGDHHTMHGLKQLYYLTMSYGVLGGYSFWLVPAFIGGFLALFYTRPSLSNKNIVGLLAGLVVVYSLYPVFGGQFWTYHWFPFQYFIILLSSLTFVQLTDLQDKLSLRLSKEFLTGIILFCSLFFMILYLMPPADYFRQITFQPIVIKDGRVDGIANYLKDHLKPGDKVQPLDWTGGAVHAMLISRAEVATPFIYDFHFYHHISRPYIQTLRQRFIEALKNKKPRYIIEIFTEKPWVWGKDTTLKFNELREYIKDNYMITTYGEGWCIYEINK